MRTHPEQLESPLIPEETRDYSAGPSVFQPDRLECASRYQEPPA